MSARRGAAQIGVAMALLGLIAGPALAYHGMSLWAASVQGPAEYQEEVLLPVLERLEDVKQDMTAMGRAAQEGDFQASRDRVEQMEAHLAEAVTLANKAKPVGDDLRTANDMVEEALGSFAEALEGVRQCLAGLEAGQDPKSQPTCLRTRAAWETANAQVAALVDHLQNYNLERARYV
jgi:hypothetical protein